MASRLNVGAIGLGRLGRVYAQDLAQRVPNARLVAVADQKADLAEEFAREFGVPKWYKSHQDLLADKDVEAVAVVTSTSTHKEVVLDAVGNGKAIFCEKPIAMSLEEASEMLREGGSRGRVFSAGLSTAVRCRVCGGAEAD